MKNKTCGECEHCTNKKIIATCKHIGILTGDIPACSKFEPKVITNGDVIREGGNAAIVEFAWTDPCLHCAYSSGKCKDKICKDGQIAWLNATADCVKQNGNHDTQADLCKADNTESEGGDE
jgi:hypothetical protein